VIVAPLTSEGNLIGALYLESVHASSRLSRQHAEFAAVVAEYAGKALEFARRVKALKEENQRLQNALRLEHNLIGGSLPMQHVMERLARIAQTDATALVRGETGTGKELAARAIHENSARAGKPFEAINCALLSDTLLQSELFGHERGSFTGAVALKKGKLELADGGTLFLDELGSLGEPSQAMLLRVLQNREFQRLGGTRTISVDIRIIAATNEDLEDAIQKKTFRQDLYFRLNVVSLTMPPLRERRDDIPLLAGHFTQLYSRKNKRVVRDVSMEALRLLQAYDWPGNVRELENVIEHAIVFGSTDEVMPEDLPESLLAANRAPGSAVLEYHDAVREAKRNIVLSAMQKASGDYGQAAKQLGIHVNNLHRLIRELELKPLLAAAANAAQNRP
jgi:Nif-specific regulatory protein